VYDIMVHVEPLGNVEESERYGLAGKDMSEGGGEGGDG
jgi:hypothetical protein